MKWLGQHIVDLISRFRSDVYLDSPTAGGSDPDKFLGIDSNNKIIYRTGTQVLSDIGGGDGDITGVTAGVGLSGGGTSDAVTLTLDLSELSDVTPANGDKLATLDSDGSTEQLTTIASLATLFSGTGLTAASSVINVDAAQSGITSLGTLTGLTLDGDKNVTPGDGAMVHVDTSDITDNATSEEGTAAKYTHVNIEAPRLFATNETVTTTDAATLYIQAAPSANTNQTITNAWALWVDAGNARFDGDIDLEGDMDINGTLETDALTVGGTNVLTGSLITTLGTISAGVWQGTAIATDQQKHLVYFDFKGFGTSDGTNYEIPDIMSDNKAPFDHNVSTGSDGLTATAPNTLMRAGGHVMPRAGTLKKWTGWASSSTTSGTASIALFKFTPVRNDSNNVSPVLLKATSFTSLGNTKLEDFAETSFSVAVSAGDIIISGIKNDASGKLMYFTSTLEVEYDG